MELSSKGGTPSPYPSQVLLISMPFGPLFQPSIGLSLLKEVLRGESLPAEILYFTVKFAEIIGSKAYTKISTGQPYVDLAGEWLFAKYLFDEDEHSHHSDYVDDVLRRKSPLNSRQAVVAQTYIDLLLYVENYIEAFLKEATDEVLQRKPTILGFTSTFQQHIASLCLAKRIKARAPEITIVMGGGNCEGAMGMETIRQFPFIDAIVSGEGEIILPQLVKHVFNNKSIDMLQGVFTQNNIDFVGINGQPLGAPPIYEMDSLPTPNYDDYFTQLDQSSLRKTKAYRILFETSRGCWWGERNHCTFCGLNGETMAYRSKSAERALAELVDLVERYPDHSVWVVDNILDMTYFQDFIPRLGDLKMDLDLFYEVKANLRKDQLVAMRHAGIKNLQPGIESLNNHVLKLMKKGVSWLQNVQILKWAKELDIIIHWNILWGFPEETPEDYAEMQAVLPAIYHLNPPTGAAKIRLDRFSPHFDNANEHGFTNVRPALPYQYIYPFAPDVLANLAYHYFYDYADNRDIRNYTQPFYQKIKDWRAAYESSEVFQVDLGTYLLIWDLRDDREPNLTILNGIERYLYLECDSLRNTRQLTKQVQSEFGVETVDIHAILQPCIDRRLMLQDEKLYLSLANNLGQYDLHLSALHKLRALAPQAPIKLNETIEFDPTIHWRVDNSFFLLDTDGQPMILYKALCDYIDYQQIQSFVETPLQTLANIQIDI